MSSIPTLSSCALNSRMAGTLGWNRHRGNDCLKGELICTPTGVQQYLVNAFDVECAFCEVHGVMAVKFREAPKTACAISRCLRFDVENLVRLSAIFPEEYETVTTTGPGISQCHRFRLRDEPCRRFGSSGFLLLRPQ